MIATQTVGLNYKCRKRPISRVLVVEDCPTQALQLQGILASDNVEVVTSPDAESSLILLEAVQFDLIIADIGLPGMSGIDLCHQVKNHPTKSALPIILMTLLSDPINILRGLECGADNFIPKPYDANHLLARVHAILDRNANNSKNSLPAGVDVVFQGKTVTINSDKEQILDLLIATFEDIVRTNRELQASKAELAAAKCKVDEYAQRLEGLVRTTEAKRNRAEHALVESERHYRRLVEFSPDAIFINRANKIAYANTPCFKLVGASSPEQVLGKSILEFIHSDYHAIVAEQIRILESGKPVPLSEDKLIRLDGTLIDVEISASPFLDDGAPAVQMVCRDISARKALEAQFYQSQKMEAFGKLAGGIAHDFNNLLTVILGLAELMLIKLPDDNTMKGAVLDISKAGERVAHLTRQLLAFSRKAVIEPKVLDLSVLLVNMENMLQRLIGEDISLLATIGPSLDKVKADAGQIEQVILNLAVNARDAMPQGGNLTIKACDVELDSDYAVVHPHIKPGRYVMLSVTDTGTGMSEQVKACIFEPFFTTKGPSNGTGLGLATVYGIVTQCGGYCEVDTELGRGSSFKVYLPAIVDQQPSGGSVHECKSPPRGKETILLVEDEEDVRAVTKRILQSLEYTVLEARGGEQAIRTCESHADAIHLLITDVVMPEMGGQQVAEQVANRRHGIKTLFVSGYTDDAVMRHGVLESQVAFLQKPFTPQGLANKIREVLGH